MTGRLLAAARRVGRALLWPFATRTRLLLHGWWLAFVVVGNAAAAHAADGFIVAPDLGSAGGPTLFEKYDVSAYSYPVDTDSDHDGVESPQWNIVNVATNFVTWLSLSLLRGALVCLQWMLDLTIYADEAERIDTVMASLAASVFYPLLGVTLVIAGATTYSKGRRDGGGAIGEIVWMVAATVFAIAFVSQPSTVLGALDDARASMSNAMMTGYSKAAGGSESSIGYPTPDTGTDKDGAVRQLTDGLWNTYGVSGWCFTAWKSLDSCAVVGQQYLADPEAESGAWGAARVALEGDGDVEPFGEDTPWVRGQDEGRLGAALLLGFVAGFAGVCLLALFVYGLMPAIGLAILPLIGVIFMLGWMISGRPRAMGIRWLEALIGTFIQSLLVTTIIGAVMVCGAILNAGLGTYGIFGTAMLNVTALILGLRYRAQFEQIVGFGTGATGNSVVSSYMAAKMVTGGARMGSRMLRRSARAVPDGLGAVRSTGHGLGYGTAVAGTAASRAVDTGSRAAHAAYQSRLAPLLSSTAATLRTGASDVAGMVRSDVDYFGGRTRQAHMPSPGGGKKKAPPSAPLIPIGVPVSRPAASAPSGSRGAPPPPGASPRLSTAPRTSAAAPSSAPASPGSPPRLAAQRRYRVTPVQGGQP